MPVNPTVFTILQTTKKNFQTLFQGIINSDSNTVTSTSAVTISLNSIYKGC